MDTEDLLRLLNVRKVEFVVIGATAFPVHGYARASLDIDIFIRPEPKNASHVFEALGNFGYDLSDITLHRVLPSDRKVAQSNGNGAVFQVIASIGQAKGGDGSRSSPPFSS